MGFIYRDDELSEDENEDDLLVANESEFKAGFSKMGKKNPFIFSVKLPISKKLSIHYDIKSLTFNKQLGLYGTDFVSSICRISSLVNIPIDLISSEIFIESFGSPISSMPRNTISPLTDRSLMGMSFMKSSLFFQLGTLNGASRPFKATSFGTSPTRTSEFTGSPFRVCDALSREPNSKILSPSSQISNLNIFENSLVTCSSINSASSYLSNSSPSISDSKGVVYCVWKNGSLNYIYKDSEDSGNVYTANIHKVDSSVDNALDYLYIFHAMKGNKASEYVGKMKVFNSLLLNPNLSKVIETEFVLFGVEDKSTEEQGMILSATKIKGFSTKVSKIFRSNHSYKHKPTSKISDPNFQPETFVPEFDELEFTNHIKDGFQPNLEQAAIVVKSLQHSSEKEVENGGWGLKFLEKITADCVHASIEKCKTNINAIFSNGFHGSPIKGSSYPSTIIERWKSNGKCDCGGWDVGCPVTVLHNENGVMENDLTEDDSQENSNIVDLFKEGAKQVEPALKMVKTSESAYTMYFQPSLSALQAFAIGMAIIHSQTPALYPKL